MADVFLSANQQSVTVQSFMDASLDDLSYYIPGNYGSVSRSRTQISPSPAGAVSNPAGKEVNFLIPRAGITSGFLFEHQLTSATVGTTYITGDSVYTTESPAGLGVFSLVELRARGQVICSNTDNYIRARVDSEKTDLALACKRVSRLWSTNDSALVSTWASGGVVYTYQPVFFFMNEDIRANWDSSFHEPVTVRCVYNSAAGNGYPYTGGGTVPLDMASITSYMWLDQTRFEQFQWDQLTARNFDKSRPFTQLGYGVYDDTATLTGATSQDITLRCQNAISRMYVFIKNNKSAEYARINTVKLTCNGQVIYNAVPHQVQNFEKYKWGAGSTLALCQNSNAHSNIDPTAPTVLAETNGPIAIHFCRENDRRFNSGCVSFKGLNNPILTITYDSLTAANFDYHVVSEYFLTTSIDSNNGAISTSLGY